jgi:hypothetical protein
MDFSTLIIIVIGLSVLGVIGTIVFWVGVVYFGAKAVQSYQQEMDAMMMSYTENLANLKNTYGNQIPPQAQQQVFTQYLQAQNALNQFDNLSAQRHDLFVSDMMGQASSVGIDVSNWN